jgi:hypothetical protein
MSELLGRALSRRRVLGSVVAVAGVAGLQGIGAETAAAAAPARGQLVLFASGLRSNGGRRARDVGAQYVISGVLSRAAAGAPSGEFFSQATVVHRNHLPTATLGTLQAHTFVLDDGSITGTGALDHRGVGDFVVTGGTGAYHGTGGSYTVQQDVDAFSGGTAVYSFTLTAGKVS